MVDVEVVAVLVSSLVVDESLLEERRSVHNWGGVVLLKTDFYVCYVFSRMFM